MTRTLSFTLVCLSIGLAASVHATGETDRSTRQLTLKFAGAGDHTLEVRAINGSISVEAYDGSDVLMTVAESITAESEDALRIAKRNQDAMRADHCRRNAQAHPAAALVATAQRIRAVKALEDALALRGRHSRTVVDDIDLDVSVLGVQRNFHGAPSRRVHQRWLTSITSTLAGSQAAAALVICSASETISSTSKDVGSRSSISSVISAGRI